LTTTGRLRVLSQKPSTESLAVQDFRKLSVWRKAHASTLLVYHVSRKFPAAARYGLQAQLRRSAISIGANIAEGCGRYSGAEKAHCFQLAVGSASEVQNYLLLSRDLGFLEEAVFERLSEDVVAVKRMLGGLLRKLRQARRNSTKTPKWQRRPGLPDRRAKTEDR
jgi:four helix bundle protein